MEKSACDAEIGVLNRAVDRAIIGKKVVINNTKDLFEFSQEKFILDEPYTKRNFFYVKADEISRNRPETNVKTIPNTRKLHNIENTTEPYLIKVRNLSCFCVNCVKGIFENCLNSDYVSAYQSKKITLLKMKQDANKGKETVTNENKEATKEHIETMLTKKAKLLMQRKQLNADKDGKENRETELGDCKKTKKTQTEIKASKLKRKRFGRVVKKKEKNLKVSLSNQEIRRGPLEDVKEGNKKQINVCKDSEGTSEFQPICL